MNDQSFESDQQPGVEIAPPPARHESAPAPRNGYAWVPGYWSWANHRHFWIGGHWERERRGYHWMRHRWVQHDGRWFLRQGGWTADENREPAHARA